MCPASLNTSIERLTDCSFGYEYGCSCTVFQVSMATLKQHFLVSLSTSDIVMADIILASGYLLCFPEPGSTSPARIHRTLFKRPLLRQDRFSVTREEMNRAYVA